MGSWFETGNEGLAAAEARRDSLYGPPRYFIKVGAQGLLVFVDTEPFCVDEHNPKIGGSFDNQTTCIVKLHPNDPACCIAVGRNTAYYVGYRTVLDCEKWVDKRGKAHQFEMKLLPAKLPSLKLLKRKMEDRAKDGGTLGGSVYKVNRDGDKQAAIGGDYTFEKAVEDPAKLFEVAMYKGKKLSDLYTEAEGEPEKMKVLLNNFVVPRGEDGKLVRGVLPRFNYEHLLAPKSPEEIRALFRGVKFDEDEKTGADAIPF